MPPKRNFSNVSPHIAASDDSLRSKAMRYLITLPPMSAADGSKAPPRSIVQFWDDKEAIPADVQGCMETWESLRSSGFEYLLFDDASANGFIHTHFGTRERQAFGRCSHPAMRADYFRLCFLLAHGGFYVDADDVYLGQPIDHLFIDGRLKVQPLCYDIATGLMLDPFLAAGESEGVGRTFYVNNNPLVAAKNHPIIQAALERATSQLLNMEHSNRDIQSLTGPGNLTAVIVEHALKAAMVPDRFGFQLLDDWGSTAESKWPLDYRDSDRNWRNWVRESEVAS